MSDEHPSAGAVFLCCLISVALAQIDRSPSAATIALNETFPPPRIHSR